MSTTPLYLEETYDRAFEATVTDVADGAVVLDRTAFYPTGGGQPHDTGTLATDDAQWAVTAVSGRSAIQHHLDGEPPSAGTTVQGHLDWDRRYAHMRYHTAQHLLSAVLVDEYDAPTTGNQLYADRARLDCAHDRLDETMLQELEGRVNELIDADLQVRWYELDRATAERELDPERTRFDLLPESVDPIRVVEIEDIDRTACAGTHVERTGEIGRMTVTGRETAGHGRERIRFELEARS